MPLVAAFDDVNDLQFKRQSVVTPFLQASGGALTLFQKSAGDTPDLVAFLRDGEPHASTPPHFHTVDQFQVMVGGNGRLGRHHVVGYCVHFARAYTPYGPLVGNTEGLSFFTLRARPDPGAQYLPESSAALKGMPHRRPWQITRQIQFPPPGAAGTAALQEISGLKDERGLFGYTLTMGPDGETHAPDPSGGDGQYLIAVKGSLWHGGKEHKSYTVVFVEPKDGPLLVHAGAQGLEAIILNFPKRDIDLTAAARPVPNVTMGAKKWQCGLCAFAYDESVGLPEDGIASGTQWKDIPQDWTCPDCGTSKTDFQAL